MVTRTTVNGPPEAEESIGVGGAVPATGASRRITKTLAALLGGQGIQILSQFCVPPLFLAAYGVRGYGEWLVLSAAVGYMSTLDFGLQNYVTNQLTILYHQGRRQECRQLQSVGLRVMAGLLSLGILLSGLVFVLPVERWLDLSRTHFEVASCLFLLALQVLLAVVLGQWSAIFRSFGEAHRGAMWANGYRFLLLAITMVLVWCRVGFVWIALNQAVAVIVCLMAVYRDLRRLAPPLVPTWGSWDPALARTVIRESGFFALFTFNNFLLYQLPLVAIHRVLGSTEVVMFSVARMVFSSARQLVAVAQSALAPEISRLFGTGDQVRLRRLHRDSESAVLFAVALANLSLLVGSPLLLRLWVGRPELFEPSLYLMTMLVGVVSSLKDYKLQFQCATNTHVRASVVTSAANVLLALALVPALRTGGAAGFLTCWLALEFVQLVLVHRFNHPVLGGGESNSPAPAVRLLLLLTPAAAGVVEWDLFWRGTPTAGVLLGGFLAFGCVAAAAFWAFNLARFLPSACRRVRRGLA